MKRRPFHEENESKSSDTELARVRENDSGEARGSSRVETLHRSIGNQAVGELYERGELQPRLTVSSPDDEHEREAERVAKQVLRADEAAVETGADDGVARSTAAGGPVVDVDSIHRKSDAGSGGLDADREEGIRSLEGGGRPLPGGTRSYFESRFGRDFGDVSVHTGAKADEAARSINAEAFTHGTDIVFRSGRYDPHSAEGKRLVAHELTHVVQQTGRGGTDTGTVQRFMGFGSAAEKAAELGSWAADKAGEAASGIATWSEDKVINAIKYWNNKTAEPMSISDEWKTAVDEFAKSSDSEAARKLAAGRANDPDFYVGGKIHELAGNPHGVTLDNAVYFASKDVAIDTYVHELTHVYQYNSMGEISFLQSYFSDALSVVAQNIINGTNLNPGIAPALETEAYNTEYAWENWAMNNTDYGTSDFQDHQR